MMGVVAVILILNLPENELRISFLNIGQGDSIYIRTPDDYSIIIDGGPSSKILEELSEVMPLYNRTVDLILITHPHADHVNGLVEVIKRYDVKGIMIVGTPSYNYFYQKILELIKEKNIPLYFAKADNDFLIGKFVELDVLWPIEFKVGVPYENLNNASLAVKINYGDHSILLSGDAEIEEEQELIKSGFDLSADILKVGHHGSRTASSINFLDKVNPKTAVIQSGIDNSFGHPHKETLRKLIKRGIEIRRNDLEGRIDFKLSLYQPPVFEVFAQASHTRDQ